MKAQAKMNATAELNPEANKNTRTKLNPKAKLFFKLQVVMIEMFDYQAGEKYKLTLVMTGVTGVVIGAALTILLSAPTEAPHKSTRGGRRPRAASPAVIQGRLSG